jgi:hypothetical protein
MGIVSGVLANADGLMVITQRNYLGEVRQRVCHGVAARPNPKRPSSALTNRFLKRAPSHWGFGIPKSTMLVMELGVITIIAGFPPLSVAWTR